MYSIDKLISAIDDHPLRWEVITLESSLSLPTLSKRGGEPFVDFFFYPVGGPQGARTLGLPYYIASGAINNEYAVTYKPIDPETFSEIYLAEGTLGSASLGDLSRGEYDESLKEIYQVTESLIPVYFGLPDSSAKFEKKAAIEKYCSIFEKIALQPLLITYKILNPSFFEWLEQQT